MSTHPLDPAQAIRRRIVAPAGMDAVAAKEWGRAEAFKLYRELCQRPVDDAEGKDGQRPTEENVRTIKTLAEFWPAFEAGHVAELKHSSKLNYGNAWIHIREVLGPLRLDAIDGAREKERRAGDYDERLARLNTAIAAD